ncbi:MAG: MFS transporter [Deinococcota bacterium]
MTTTPLTVSSQVPMLRNRHFILLWLVTSTTTFALELFAVTIVVVIFEQTNSTLQAAGAMVARMLPAFLLSPLAGVLVDHLPRKYVLVIMDSLRVLLVALVWLLLRPGTGTLVWGLYAVLAGLAAADVFHRPARLALIPSVVAHRQLVRANSFMLVSSQVLTALAYTVGGWLVLHVSMTSISLAIVSLFAVSVVMSSLMPHSPVRETSQHSLASWWRAFCAGWHYLQQHPVARPLVVMETIEHVPHSIWTSALMLAFTVQALQGDATGWGYQITGYFSGMMIGSLLALAMASWLERVPGRIIIINAALSGVLTLAYAASHTVWLAVVWAFIFGPPFALRDVAQDALLQSRVEGSQLGRVYATREMLRSVVFMLSGLVFAWLSSHVDIRTIYITGGFMYLLTGIYALSNRNLRHSKLTSQEAKQTD